MYTYLYIINTVVKLKNKFKCIFKLNSSLCFFFLCPCTQVHEVQDTDSLCQIMWLWLRQFIGPDNNMQKRA